MAHGSRQADQGRMASRSLALAAGWAAVAAGAAGLGVWSGVRDAPCQGGSEVIDLHAAGSGCTLAFLALALTVTVGSISRRAHPWLAAAACTALVALLALLVLGVSMHGHTVTSCLDM